MKQAIVLRKDLNMRKGKMIAQGAHASLKALFSSPLLLLRLLVTRKWGFAKIGLQVSSEASLLDVYARAQAAGLPCSLVMDLGKTEFNGVATFTAVAVGPANPDKVNSITQELKLL